MTARFFFSDVVVVEENLIGTVVKTWQRANGPQAGSYYHEVYVRSYNGIKEYEESQIKHFVYSKELAEEELEYYE